MPTIIVTEGPSELPEGSEEEIAAAARIQAQYRGNKDRKSVAAMVLPGEPDMPEGGEEEIAAAARIQAQYRGNKDRERVAAMGLSNDQTPREQGHAVTMGVISIALEGSEEETAAAARLQAQYRGNKDRKFASGLAGMSEDERTALLYGRLAKIEEADGRGEAALDAIQRSEEEIAAGEEEIAAANRIQAQYRGNKDRERVAGIAGMSEDERTAYLYGRPPPIDAAEDNAEADDGGGGVGL